MDKLAVKAKELGLDALAVTDAQPFPDTPAYLADLKEKGLYPRFAHPDFQLRADPQQLLPGSQSIISAALAYKTVDPTSGPGTGTLSRYAWGHDYHTVFSRRLEVLAQWLRLEYGVSQYFVAVDTKPALDRAIALRAGLGWLGSNCCIFVPNYGSWVVLGSIFVDVSLPATNSGPLAAGCPENCNLCVKACPTQALFEPYKINPHICISYLTQLKGLIPQELRPKMGTKLWGCDVCQQVCPINKKARTGTHSQFFPLETACIPIIPLINISRQDFAKRFGSTALAWAGRNVLQRNAAIVCGNLRLTQAVEELKISMHNPKVWVRAVSAWALGQIGTMKARNILANSIADETDPTVKIEIHQALNQ